MVVLESLVLWDLSHTAIRWALALWDVVYISPEMWYLLRCIINGNPVGSPSCNPYITSFVRPITHSSLVVLALRPCSTKLLLNPGSQYSMNDRQPLWHQPQDPRPVLLHHRNVFSSNKCNPCVSSSACLSSEHSLFNDNMAHQSSFKLCSAAPLEPQWSTQAFCSWWTLFYHRLLYSTCIHICSTLESPCPCSAQPAAIVQQLINRHMCIISQTSTLWQLVAGQHAVCSLLSGAGWIRHATPPTHPLLHSQ